MPELTAAIDSTTTSATLSNLADIINQLHIELIKLAYVISDAERSLPIFGESTSNAIKEFQI